MTPFSGVGVLAELPHGLPPGADWIAFRAAGLDPPVWMSPDGPIVQAEGPDQLAAAIRYGETHQGSKALICNDTVRTWPSGWACIPEAYTSMNANATPDQMTRDFRGRGATIIAPCVLCSDEGTRWPLERYAPSLKLAHAEGAVGCSVFDYDSMAADDFKALAIVQQIFASLPPPPPSPPPKNGPSSIVVRGEMERVARAWERQQPQTKALDLSRIRLGRRLIGLDNKDEAPWNEEIAAEILAVINRRRVPK